MYYAEATGNSVTEDIYEGGLLRHKAGSEPYCDLWGFDTKKERDEFVNKSSSHSVITSAEARKKHAEQFRYWKNAQ